MTTKAPKVFKEFFKNATVEEGIMLEYCFNQFGELILNDFKTSERGLDKKQK